MRTDLPFQLDYPRAWRTYLGGARLDELHGVQRGMGRDGHFPEEWIMSVVAARNSGREDFPEEGLSHLAQTPRITLKSVLESDPAAYLGSTHAAAHGAHPGVLVKLIDSSERLTIQVHPDRETAQRLLGSSFGKTECWHIQHHGRGVQVCGLEPACHQCSRKNVRIFLPWYSPGKL